MILSSIRIFVFTLVVLMTSTIAKAAVPVWQIVPNESSLTFTAIQNGSPVTGAFKNFTGEINFDPADLNASNAKIDVDIESVTASYKEVSDTLKTPAWFDAKKYPHAVYKTTGFTKTGSNIYTANGMLTIRDKTLPITLTFELDEYSQTKAHAKGSTSIKRTMFDVGRGEWASVDNIKDDVKVDFIISAIKK